MPEIPDYRTLPLLPKELWHITLGVNDSSLVLLGLWEHPAGCVWYEKAPLSPVETATDTAD